MFASHHKLINLVAIVDRNRLSATNFTEETLKLEPLAQRWQSFGWEATTVDGHNFKQILEILSTVQQRKSELPLVVIANTTKGKGVSFMENSPLWHHRLPKGEEVRLAFQELRSSDKNSIS
jgi:transketolase